MLKIILKLSLIMGLLLGLLVACQQEKKAVYKGQDLSVLSDWGKEIILPAYKYYQSAIVELNQAAQDFKQEASELHLKALQDAEVQAYKAIQEVLIFQFSYAEDAFLIPLANTYPTKVEHSANEEKYVRTIAENIALVQAGKEAEITLKQTSSVIQYAYQGLPALDYLLFDEAHNLAYYRSKEGQAARQYILMLTSFLKKNVDELVKVWDERLLKAYINDDDGSSNGFYAQTINGFIKAYEKQIRAEKVGLAAGAIKAQQGKPSPTIIEAYYNGKIDKELLILALKSSQNFFNGKVFHSEKKVKGLYDILVKEKHQKLADRINQQYELIYKEIEAMPLSLKETAVQNNEQMRKLYNALQRNVAYYKTDMLAALNVSVGYQDTDGD